MTIGNGQGVVLFWDLRAGKFLESTMNTNRAVTLKSSRGWVVSFKVFKSNACKLTSFFLSNEMIITCKIWKCKVCKSTRQLSTHTATIPVVPGYSPLVDPYKSALKETTLHCFNDFLMFEFCSFMLISSILLRYFHKEKKNTT